MKGEAELSRKEGGELLEFRPKKRRKRDLARKRRAACLSCRGYCSLSPWQNAAWDLKARSLEKRENPDEVGLGKGPSPSLKNVNPVEFAESGKFPRTL